jgi:hypothetical protein
LIFIFRRHLMATLNFWGHYEIRLDESDWKLIKSCVPLGSVIFYSLSQQNSRQPTSATLADLFAVNQQGGGVYACISSRQALSLENFCPALTSRQAFHFTRQNNRRFER